MMEQGRGGRAVSSQGWGDGSDCRGFFPTANGRAGNQDGSKRHAWNVLQAAAFRKTHNWQLLWRALAPQTNHRRVDFHQMMWGNDEIRVNSPCTQYI